MIQYFLALFIHIVTCIEKILLKILGGIKNLALFHFIQQVKTKFVMMRSEIGQT